MKIIIAGSRSASKSNVLDALTACHFSCDMTEVVCGGARGADNYGAEIARANRVPVKMFPAKWDTRGRSAGFIRNGEMVDYADALIAVWDMKSNGTRDTIERATRKGIPVFVFAFSPG